MVKYIPFFIAGVLATLSGFMMGKIIYDNNPKEDTLATRINAVCDKKGYQFGDYQILFDEPGVASNLVEVTCYSRKAVGNGYYDSYKRVILRHVYE